MLHIARLSGPPQPTPPVTTRESVFDTQCEDQKLARTHRDLWPQLNHPSTARRCHDVHANDDSRKLELSRVGEHFMKALPNTAGKAQRAAFAVLTDTLKNAYEKSPTFRRIYNHAWEQDLHMPDRRWTVGTHAEAALADRQLGLEQLTVSGVAQSYQFARGTYPLDLQRSVLNALLPALTGFIVEELNHPRGPVVEYANIILKEIGHPAPACTIRTLPVDHQRIYSVPSDNRLRSSLQAILAMPTISSAGALTTFRQRAETLLDREAERRLQGIASRPRSANPILARRSADEFAAARTFSPLLMRLLRTLKGCETPMQTLSCIAQQNRVQLMFKSRMDKYRDAFAMVAERDGDCVSFLQSVLNPWKGGGPDRTGDRSY
ncbi:PipA/GogA/GtgA family type III secretion system effector [Pseudomonas sp. 10C3]|uniref:PipA/GogA/GtgA family type III secretion system effector n=2 Tax=unclassified Pseudomonas TaxID=196821 RepID=UPI002E7FE8BC|nr:PipA/GogA/GtgA family type III secretion system effector [Pseudomonas sp. 10C3]MEE3509587.1 PipA/GogA/GtgA family type III secretion system effector [Pseudomonas sp. 10C3]